MLKRVFFNLALRKAFNATELVFNYTSQKFRHACDKMAQAISMEMGRSIEMKYFILQGKGCC